MTIHSDWSRVLHEECPEAFNKQPPKTGNRIGIVDGHLQLMRLNPHCGSWANFVMYQFIKPLRMLLSCGCNRVVLCFDSYEHVPAYKNMTQVKRMNKHVVPTFHEDQELPRQIPDDPMPYLMNRHFKKKIIDMVCDKAPSLLQLEENQHFIIDYQCVIEYTKECGKIARPLPEMIPMGESDVKFTRYVRKYGNALVHAIDGDYLMIALLYYASNDRMTSDNKIHIYRQLASPLDNNGEGGKRSISGAPKNTATTATRKPVMCWVDVQLLYHIIYVSMRQGMHSQLTSLAGRLSPDQQLVRSAVFLMLLAGTDFSRALPLLGPKRIWAYMPNVVVALVAAVGENQRTISNLICDGVIGTMYTELFDKHIVRKHKKYADDASSLSDVLYQLQNSALSATTKGRLPSVDQITCTVKNIQWVVEYWETVNGHVETPLAGENGYLRGTNPKCVVFADTVDAV